MTVLVEMEVVVTGGGVEVVVDVLVTVLVVVT